jgi:hypothetical protein
MKLNLITQKVIKAKINTDYSILRFQLSNAGW